MTTPLTVGMRQNDVIDKQSVPTRDLCCEIDASVAVTKSYSCRACLYVFLSLCPTLLVMGISQIKHRYRATDLQST